MFRSVLVSLMIVLAAPAYAGSRFGGGSHGGFQGDGSEGGSSRDDGVRDHGFHRGVRRARDLFVVYGCGFGFDCGVYDPGGGAGNAVTGSGDYGREDMAAPAAAIAAAAMFPTP